MRNIRLTSITAGRDDEPHDSFGPHAKNASYLGNQHSSMGTKKCSRVDKLIKLERGVEGTYGLHFSPDGESFAAVFCSGHIKVFDKLGNLLHNVKKGGDDGEPVMCVKYHPRNQYVFYCADIAGIVHLCKMKDKVTLHTFAKEHKNEINSFDINISGERLVTGGKDAVLRTYDLDTGKVVKTYRRTKHAPKSDPTHMYHKQRIFKIRFNPNEFETFLTGGWDNCVKIWDLRTKHGLVTNIPGPQIYGDAIDVRGSVILTGSWRSSESLQTWDIRSGKLLDAIGVFNRKPSVYGEYVYCAIYINETVDEDLVLAGLNGTLTFEVINTNEKRAESFFPQTDSIYSIDSCEDMIIVGGLFDNIVMIKHNDQSIFQMDTAYV